MALNVNDLENQSRYRQLIKIPYDELIPFILDYLRRKSGLIVFFWSACILTLGLALTVRVNLSGYFPYKYLLLHSILGLVVFPLLYIPVHELLHIIPYYLTGAKNIRVGMDLKQYMFYVTAHRHVTTRKQFGFVAWFPFTITTIILVYLVLSVPGLWKWSLSLFLFVHTTMCAGDFAMLNYFRVNRKKKLFTWDDADEKMAYFYEEIQ